MSAGEDGHHRAQTNKEQQGPATWAGNTTGGRSKLQKKGMLFPRCKIVPPGMGWVRERRWHKACGFYWIEIGEGQRVGHNDGAPRKDMQDTM